MRVNGKPSSKLHYLAFLGLVVLSGCSSIQQSEKISSTPNYEVSERQTSNHSAKVGYYFDSYIEESSFGAVDNNVVQVKQIKIRNYPDYIKKITLTNDLLFDFAKHNIKPKVRRQISAVTKTIQSDYRDHYVFVVGHTDSVGRAPANSRLSSKRAVSVIQAMGRSKYKVNPTKIEVIPAGEYLPLVPNDTKANRAKNRRVEIYVSSSRELVFQYFRQYGCPEPQCTTREFTALKVDRNYMLLPTNRKNAKGIIVRANSEVTRIRDNTVEGKQREKYVDQQHRNQTVKTDTREIRYEPVVREMTVQSITRKMHLPAHYNVNLEDKTRTSLFKYL